MNDVERLDNLESTRKEEILVKCQVKFQHTSWMIWGRKERKISVNIVDVPSTFEPGIPEYKSCDSFLFVRSFYRQIAQKLRFQAAL
jgi:hypothetical protein